MPLHIYTIASNFLLSQIQILFRSKNKFFSSCRFLQNQSRRNLPVNLPQNNGYYGISGVFAAIERKPVNKLRQRRRSSCLIPLTTQGWIIVLGTRTIPHRIRNRRIIRHNITQSVTNLQSTKVRCIKHDKWLRHN